MTHTSESLISFRDRVVESFRSAKIHCPVHFPSGNEDQLIEIFKDFRPGVDYLFSGWRSMYHALLAGAPEQWVWDEIHAGRSMYLMSKQYRIMCSSIVGGILPIACGVAAGIKRNGENAKAWVFVGDMTKATGLFSEFARYCAGFNLPVEIVVEDNGLSTNSPTKTAWGQDEPTGATWIEYEYARTLPHVGLAERVQF